ncbi:MAG: HRDC domain-containing protein [Myxococcales bacterium]|nr:HRDC domain-containing protein [Myxococcales bacterium]
MDVQLLTREDELPAAIDALLGAEEIPLDVESNGLHAYRADLCTLQLAVVEGGEVRRVYVVDTMAIGDAGLAPLSRVLSVPTPRKLIHDLAFDARILAQHGLMLAGVRDTAIAARFLAIAATGLGTLLETRVGQKVDKRLQHHDWGARPFDASMIAYLGADVAHLPALARSLFAEAAEKDIVPEIEEETAYRLAGALAAGPDERPPWARIKGMLDLDAPALGALSVLAEVREAEARALDVPVHTVIGNEALLAIARTRKPETVRAVAKGRAGRIAADLIRVLATAPEDVSAEDRARFVTPPPRLSRDEIELRKRRDAKLRSFRKAAARERGVDEQVVLPGHCLNDLVALGPTTIEELARIEGLGGRRIARDGEALLAALTAAQGRAAC